MRFFSFVYSSHTRARVIISSGYSLNSLFIPIRIACDSFCAFIMYFFRLSVLSPNITRKLCKWCDCLSFPFMFLTSCVCVRVYVNILFCLANLSSRFMRSRMCTRHAYACMCASARDPHPENAVTIERYLISL